MAKKRIEKEKNEFIFKYQREDIIDKLIRIFGEDFRKYRQNFEKTQTPTGFVPDFPITVTLEPINRCNLNCVMCHKEHRQGPESELSIVTLKKIIDECQRYKMPSILLGLGAEPLMYKDIKKLLNLIKSAKIQDVFFGSNGVLLDQVVETLVDNMVTRALISLDAVTTRTYKRVRGFDMLKRVEENVEKLIAYRNKQNSLLPLIRLSFIVLDINIHEAESFVNKWKDRVDYIDFQRYQDSSYVDKNVKIDEAVIKDAYCSYPFYSLNIWSNGNVTPCCSSYAEKDIIVGNICTESLKEIWGGKRMNRIRDEILSKKFRLQCKKCLYFRDRSWIDNKFKQDL